MKDELDLDTCLTVHTAKTKKTSDNFSSEISDSAGVCCILFQKRHKGSHHLLFSQKKISVDAIFMLRRMLVIFCVSLVGIACGYRTENHPIDVDVRTFETGITFGFGGHIWHSNTDR